MNDIILYLGFVEIIGILLFQVMKKKKILFEVGELDSLIKKYCKKNINYRGFYEFFDYIKIYYPHSFDEITNKTNMEIK